jgi:hypothetical protein
MTQCKCLKIAATQNKNNKNNERTFRKEVSVRIADLIRVLICMPRVKRESKELLQFGSMIQNRVQSIRPEQCLFVRIKRQSRKKQRQGKTI